MSLASGSEDLVCPFPGYGWVKNLTHAANEDPGWRFEVEWLVQAISPEAWSKRIAGIAARSHVGVSKIELA